MLAIGILLLVLAGGAALAVWLTRALQGFKADSDAALAARNAEVGRQLEGITATMDRRLGELDTKVDRRMEHASKQTNAIHQAARRRRPGDNAPRRAREGARPAAAGPAAAEGAGGFGELLLGNLLARPPPARGVLAAVRVQERRAQSTP